MTGCIRRLASNLQIVYQMTSPLWYDILDSTFEEIRTEFKRNEKKHQLRQLRSESIFPFDEEISGHHQQAHINDHLSQMLEQEEANKEIRMLIVLDTPLLIVPVVVLSQLLVSLPLHFGYCFVVYLISAGRSMEHFFDLLLYFLQVISPIR